MRASRAAAGVAAVLLTILAGIGVSRTRDASEGSGASAADRSRPTVPAATNGSHLVLMKDERKVLGWISGSQSYAGRTVSIRVGGRTARVTVDRDNTFRWAYRLAKPTRARFRVGRLGRSIQLGPPVDRRPSAFLVVDRPVYRPGQQLHFAAFLRRLDPRGAFVAIANAAVVARITSGKKKTVAARLKLTSDEAGRVVGDYRFISADPLDDYTLSLDGYAGTARFRLAEFRKSKVKLVVDGEIRGDKLRLRFAAVDFLNKPVPAAQVAFEAQVVRQPQRTRRRISRFAHAPAREHLPRIDELDPEEQLLIRAGAPGEPDLEPARARVVAQVKGEVTLNGEAGSYDLALKPEWLQQRHAVRVSAVAVDENGREQRAHHQISLQPKAPRVRLALDRQVYTPGEPIQLKLALPKGARGASTLVLMQLERLAPPSTGWPYQAHLLSSAIPHRWQWQRGNAWNTLDPDRRVGRTLADALPISGDRATVRIDRPGAYKLVVLTRFSDGKTERSEIGCAVRAPDEGPAVALKLDSTELTADGRLTGMVTSRVADPVLLLTIHDGAGIRHWQRLQLRGTSGRLDLPLPRGLAHGTVVEVQYVDREGRAHIADAFVRVRQDHRIIKISTEHEPVVAPGQHVKMTIRVDRKEPVDLVLSIYDQSLLGVAPDRSTDIRDFYLADDRVRAGRGRAILERWLGDLTVEQLIRRAKRRLERQPALDSSWEGQSVRPLLAATGTFHLQGRQLATLLRLAGYNVHWHGSPYWGGPAEPGASLLELLDRGWHGWRVAARAYGDLLVLAPTRGDGSGNEPIWAHPFGRGRFRARGDAHFSASGNAFYSASGQAFISHLPAQPVSLLEPGGGATTRVRTDFSDLAYWNAALRTNADGVARVGFKLPDSLTNWRVVVVAVSRRMHVGRHETRLRTFKPIMVWPMLPRVFTEGDRIAVYALVHNQTDRPQQILVGIKVDNGQVRTPSARVVRVAARSSAPVTWTFEPGTPGFTQILMTARGPAGSDASVKRLPVTAAAAEQRITRSGFARGEALLELPQEIDLGAARLTVTFAPSLAADLVDNLGYLVEYPYGCVEQTMSRFLPAIRVAQILERFRIQHRDLHAKLPGVVAAGIKRLLELQHPDGGWGWHARGATHEMMTPYALYGLLQAEKAGYEIGSERAIRRGLDRLRAFIQAMGRGQAADRTYAIYVYAHRRPVEQAWWRFIDEQLRKKALSDYALALALELAVRDAKPELANRLARALRRRAVTGNGHAYWRTAGFSRWGDDRFEITAAALKALVAYDLEDPLIPQTLAFFAATKRGNRWNSTKDTAMITFAIADYLARQKRLARGDHVVFSVNGAAPRKVVFTAGLTTSVDLPASALRHGTNRITFLRPSPSSLYRAVLRYTRRGRRVAPLDAGIAVTRRFYLLDGKNGGRKLREVQPGETVPWGAYLMSEVTASASKAGQLRYVLVESPKLSGSEALPADDRRFQQSSTAHVLREDRTDRVAFHHETTPSTIVDRSIVHAEFAGEFVVAPAAVELMYETGTRGHSGTFHLRVAPRPTQRSAG